MAGRQSQKQLHAASKWSMTLQQFHHQIPSAPIPSMISNLSNQEVKEIIRQSNRSSPPPETLSHRDARYHLRQTIHQMNSQPHPSSEIPQTYPEKLRELSTVPLNAVHQKRYKNWLKKRHEKDGLYYLLLFARKYRYSAFLTYGRHPPHMSLNLDKKWRSSHFEELNIALNYPESLVHVYSTTAVTYPYGFVRTKPIWITEGELHEGS